MLHLSLSFTAVAFAPQVSFRPKTTSLSLGKKEFLGGKAGFDPLGFSSTDNGFDPLGFSSTDNGITKSQSPSSSAAWIIPTTAVTLFGFAGNALADGLQMPNGLTPQTFQPVCPTSDGFYRFLQGTTVSVVGRENFVEYGPLIAGGLLRVRLELCVVESFFNEAVGPFIQQNGLSWVLPLHESVETFLAGTIFALASTFILVGSTKLVTVLITYVDVFVGIPLRLFGGFAFDRARGKPITFDIGFGPFKTRILGPPKEEEKEETSVLSLGGAESPVEKVLAVASGGFKAVGEGSKLVREVTEAVDLFVGRYLVLIATGYIGLKFLHFKVFPDFP